MALKDSFTTDGAAYDFLKLKGWKLCEWDTQREEAVLWNITQVSQLRVQSQANYRRGAPSIYQNQKRNQRPEARTAKSFQFCYVEHNISQQEAVTWASVLVMHSLHKEEDLKVHTSPQPPSVGDT